MTARRPRKLMPAERLARIAYELVAVHPGAPLFLTSMMGNPMLDKVVDQPIGLSVSATPTPKGQP